MIPVPIIELIGIIAISMMVICYALEERHPLFIILFAFGCALAAFYAFLIASYPFLLAESIWCMFALGRWNKHRDDTSKKRAF